ncbi:MAG: TonB-dependent receptor [Sphingomonadaceae bacterium]
MKASWKLSTAAFVIAALGAGASPALAQNAPAAEADRGVADIVVTATRREEALNKIPLAIQALSTESLQRLNVNNFEKLIEFLPNVRSASRGPGTSSVYIRGLSTDTPGLQITGTAGSFPSVALYLNDAPVSLPGRNLDIYAADLGRIEVLAGPQGTLFGASAEAGAVRYITNKPNLKEFHAGFNGTYTATKGGADSYAGNAFINIPIIEDKLAVRLVAYNDAQGGYIDNVAGTYQLPFNGNVGIAGRLPTGNPLLVNQAIRSCVGVANCTGSTYTAPTRQSITNDRFVRDNFNDASYIGGRAAVTLKISDDWSIDAVHLQQRLRTEGTFDFDPAVGDLKVQQFSDNYLRDNFNLETWTLNGRLGALDLIYTGSYLNRRTIQQNDYTRYSNFGLYVPYYECDAGVYYNNPARGSVCYAPVKSYQVRDTNRHWTHEFRLTTPSEGRIRATGGVFYDVNKIYDVTEWSYLNQGAGFIYVRSANPIVNPIDPNPKGVNVGFFNDVTRRDRQFAVYGEASFDIIPKELIITGGVRYYNEQASQTGSSNTSFDGVSRGIYTPPAAGSPVGTPGTYTRAAVPPAFYGISANLATNLAGLSPTTYSGFLFKGNITYKFGGGSLVYATYSDGFRPGGFNRRPCRLGSSICPTQEIFRQRTAYRPDFVKNYEIGGKFALLDKTLQINLAAYQIDWSNIQQTVFDQNISNQTFTTNLSDARIRGVEGDVTWRATSDLTFNGAFSYNKSELTRYRQNTTVLRPIGSELALSPRFQGNIRARYETELPSGLRPYIQGGVHYVGSSISSIIDNVSIRYNGPRAVYNGVVVNPGDVSTPLVTGQRQRAYTTFNAAIGISRDQWTLEIFGENLSNARPQLFTSGNDGINRITTSRPASVGLRGSFKI